MNELIKYCIDHPFGFIIFAVGCCLLLKEIRHHLPAIEHFIATLVKLLIKEFKPSKEKTMSELINAIALIVMFIITLITALPSSINHVLGIEPSEPTTHILFSAVLYLFLISVVSPIFLYLMEREKRIRNLLEDKMED